MNPEPWSATIPALTKKYKKNEVDPVLCIILNMSLTTQPTIAILKQQHPTIQFRPYKQLIQDQSNIRWKQIIYSRWALSWDTLQQRYLTAQQKHAHGEPVYFSQIIRVLWQHAHTRWQARNSYLHKILKDQGYHATKQLLVKRIAQ
eukprot:4851868-Ditylum_brightwellii.AAC.1